MSKRVTEILSTTPESDVTVSVQEAVNGLACRRNGEPGLAHNSAVSLSVRNGDIF